MVDIFVSYARADREIVEPLALALEELGWSLWWDRQIPPGKTFDEVIEEALDAASAVICVWTAEGVASRWVRTEAAEGAARGVLVPVLLREADIPLAFRRIQSADLTDWERGVPHDGFDELVGALEDLLGEAGGQDDEGDGETIAVDRALAAARAKAESQDWSGVLSILASLEADVPEAIGAREEIAELVAQARTKQSAYELYEDAELLYSKGDWNAAVDKIDELLVLDPSAELGVDLKRRAAKHLAEDLEADLERRYELASGALNARQWQLAAARLEQLVADAPEYRDAPHLLERAAQSLQAETRYDDLRRLADESRWREVQAGLAALRESHPEFGDPDGLGSVAQERVEGAVLQREVDDEPSPPSDVSMPRRTEPADVSLLSDLSDRVPAATVGAAAIVSAALPWIKPDAGMLNAFNVHASFLFDADDIRGTLNISVAVIALGVVLVFAGVAPERHLARRIAGAMLVTLVVLHAWAVLRSPIPSGELFFALGPYVALAAGFLAARPHPFGVPRAPAADGIGDSRRATVLSYSIGGLGSLLLIGALVSPSWMYDYSAFMAAGVGSVGIGETDFDVSPLVSLGAFVVTAIVIVNAIGALRRRLPWTLPVSGAIAVVLVGGFMANAAGGAAFTGRTALTELSDALGGVAWVALAGALILALSTWAAVRVDRSLRDRRSASTG